MNVLFIIRSIAIHLYKPSGPSRCLCTTESINVLDLGCRSYAELRTTNLLEAATLLRLGPVSKAPKLQSHITLLPLNRPVPRILPAARKTPGGFINPMPSYKAGERAREIRLRHPAGEQGLKPVYLQRRIPDVSTEVGTTSVLSTALGVGFRRVKDRHFSQTLGIHTA